MKLHSTVEFRPTLQPEKKYLRVRKSRKFLTFRSLYSLITTSNLLKKGFLLHHSETIIDQSWKSIPLEERQVMCDICANMTVNLTGHKRSVHGIGPDGSQLPKFLCDHCGKEFTTKANLEFHAKMHSSEEYFCSICNEGPFGNKVFSDFLFLFIFIN